ncbi:hypothetical protein [Petrotoga sibirica]|uniref:Sensor histidine kinase n=2 Tax=Petrotoga sibirica TaxID=156202 RepID=A0A4R8ER86_9BACT|nr:hypothetical protein [Petrotoga sibirica]KUK80257.1 MAG: Uncharacterized protein XD96_1608 [Petrotoga mobilis]POZ88566.1 hypothetical protein AA80_05400 [Petrotoga sibirica DSM 13575]TDX14924.1 hypothetical protein C8D74_10952 [Petrotoga sibirica]
MFLLESNVRKFLKYTLIATIILLLVLLVVESYGKYQEYLNIKRMQNNLNYNYNNYLYKVSNQRTDIREFFDFLTDNNFYLIELNYSLANGLSAKVATFIEPTQKIKSKYSISERTKINMGTKYYVILEIKEQGVKQ